MSLGKTVVEDLAPSGSFITTLTETPAQAEMFNELLMMFLFYMGTIGVFLASMMWVCYLGMAEIQAKNESTKKDNSK